LRIATRTAAAVSRRFPDRPATAAAAGGRIACVTGPTLDRAVHVPGDAPRGVRQASDGRPLVDSVLATKHVSLVARLTLMTTLNFATEVSEVLSWYVLIVPSGDTCCIRRQSAAGTGVVDAHFQSPSVTRLISMLRRVVVSPKLGAGCSSAEHN
jgi:hypothetical protein